jgi:1,6-anhydro-N-acetylmuramate kinase
MKEGVQYASLTDILTKAWSGRTTRQYKQLKGLRKESLRDNMTNVELALNTLAEASAAELSKQRSPRGFKENARVAGEGGRVAKVARQQLEQSLGRSVVTAQKASDYIIPLEQAQSQELPLDEDAK